MKEEITEQQAIKWAKYALIITVVLILFLLVLVFYFLKYCSYCGKSNYTVAESGQFGETVNGILMPIIALCAAILTFLAFYIQYEANKIQRTAFQISQFESTFFNLLSIQNQIVSSMDLQETNGNLICKGRDCFKQFYKYLRDDIGKDFNKNPSDINYLEEKYLDRYKFHQGDLGHYYRNLYHIFKYIDKSEIKDKRKYTSIVRAQLSAYELILIFYNCLSENGEEKFKPLAERYGLFKNMDIDSLFDPNHMKDYDKTAFE